MKMNITCSVFCSFMYFSEDYAAQGRIKVYTVQSVSHHDYLSLQPFCNRKYGNPANSNVGGGNAKQWFYFVCNGIIS